MSRRFSSITLTGTVRCELASGNRRAQGMFSAMRAARRAAASTLPIRTIPVLERMTTAVEVAVSVATPTPFSIAGTLVIENIFQSHRGDDRDWYAERFREPRIYARLRALICFHTGGDWNFFPSITWG